MEMETGATALAFASESLAEMNSIAIRPNTARDLPAGLEIALVSETAYAQALAGGATPVKPVETKPWGQKVTYLRDLNGCFVELCSPGSE